MHKVKNQKCIQNIGIKSFRSNRTRNVIAIIAISLTCMLFTSVLTLSSIFIRSFEESNFRQVGGYTHGSIKDVTYKEIDAFKEHPLIKEYGTTRFIGSLSDDAFSKTPAEIKYIDEIYAKYSYVEFIDGKLPTNNSTEIACSTKILDTLKITPEIGEKIPLSFSLGNSIITETFTLSGYFDTDEVIGTSFAFVSQSYADKIIDTYPDSNGSAGRIDMDIYLSRSSNIEGDLNLILEDNGYQSTDTSKSNFKDIGVNWGYLSSQFITNIDPITLSFLIFLILVFTATGYLIIYNVFRISVNNDIRFYGLLKTVGTTQKQIRKLVYRQAYLLAFIGIPIGLALGFLLGNVLAPFTLTNFNVTTIAYTINPYIFIGGAIFSLLTLFISCRIPAKIASRVSPIEAVRYTESTATKKKHRRTKKTTPLRMALANMGRFRGKTILVVLSLSLATLVLQMALLFTNGFDMNLYLEKYSSTDFLVSHSNYFTYNTSFLPTYVELDLQNTLESLDVTESGITYLNESKLSQYTNYYVTEDYLREHLQQFRSLTEEELEEELSYYTQTSDGLYIYYVDLFGVDDFILDQVTVLEGNIDKLEDSQTRYIAAIIHTDDYGNPQLTPNSPKIGDVITMRHVQDAKYINLETQEEYTTYAELETTTDDVEEVVSKEIMVDYEVVALITLPSPLSNRSYGNDKFLLPSDKYLEDTENDFKLYYAFDVDDSKLDEIASQLTTLTTTSFSNSDFESRATLSEEFQGFKNMFLLIGIFLSAVVGFIGILNFFNVILTSIHMRKREFAMLQSMGMTGNQLKAMLVYEGLIYIGITAIVVSLLSIPILPMFSNVMASSFWFYTYNPTYLPLVFVGIIFTIIGIVTPLLIYRGFHKQSIVERLRQVE